MTSIKCGHCKGTHASVMQVRLCAGQTVTSASGAQVKMVPLNTETFQHGEIGESFEPKGNVAVAIKDKWTKTATITQDGMYMTPEGTIFKVQKAVHGSGHLYAKELVVDSTFTPALVSFVYAPGAIRKLTPEMKMTIEQAKAFGALYGTCCVCGRTLTDEGSIEAGIGPVCAKKF